MLFHLSLKLSGFLSHAFGRNDCMYNFDVYLYGDFVPLWGSSGTLRRSGVQAHGFEFRPLSEGTKAIHRE